MKRPAWIGLSLVMTAYGLASALGGCGANDATTGGAGGDGGDESSSGSSGSSGTSGSSGSSGGDAGDGGDGASSSSGGLGSSNPGKVTCGAEECDASFSGGSYCCIDDAGKKCDDQFGQCDRNGVLLFCDEPADCDPNHRCCLQFGGAGANIAGCHGNPGPCSPGNLALCKASGDCDGGPCKPVTCAG